MKMFQKSTFLLFLIEEMNTYNSCFLSNDFFLFLAEVIAGQRPAPMCNYIARTFFNHVP